MVFNGCDGFSHGAAHKTLPLCKLAPRTETIKFFLNYFHGFYDDYSDHLSSDHWPSFYTFDEQFVRMKCGPWLRPWLYIVNKSWHQSPNASSDAHCFLRQAEPDNGEQIALNVHPAQAEATLPIRSELHLFCLEPGMWLTSWATSSSTTTRLRPPCLSHLLIQLLLALMSLS